MKKGSENFGQISVENPKSERAIAIEKLLPSQEDRDGLLVSAIENKKIKGDVSPEDVDAFIEVMLERIAKELAKEFEGGKTTLSEGYLEDLKAEIFRNREVVKSIMDSFGLGVASDQFMLYGLISETKNLMKRTLELYGDVGASVRIMYGAKGSTVADHTDKELLQTLKYFWDSEPVGPNKGDFPRGEDIQYYSGRDAEVEGDDRETGIKRAPGYRYIFGPTRKRKTDYCSIAYPSKFNGSFSEKEIKEMSEERVQEYALRFRDNTDVTTTKDMKLMRGYPAEWYIPGANKKRVLEDYFKRYVIPEIRKTSTKKGIR